MPLRIAVLGRGAWGQTLSELWERQGHAISSWSRRDGTAPEAVLQGVDLVVAAVAMAGVESLAQRLGGLWPGATPLLSCTKGLDLDLLATPGQLWRRHLPAAVPLVVLSGPNLAAELRQGLPAASVLASEDGATAVRLQQALSGANLRLYTNADPLGTEAAGALKNVMALAAGIADGLDLGANARASLLTRGLAEIGVVLEGLGGKAATLYGLAGLGDLMATATSELSRNYRCGRLLAQGHSPAEAERGVGATVEGLRTARAALMLARRHGWRLPICGQVVALLDGRLNPVEAAWGLMERELRPEHVAPPSRP
ncbi:NAD(P)H-dependent glycerol-3-phosphate dehydrogenase [Cyanobium sp. PCC 7001]|uniref:NAD(P)H-dependent glycerol-3-phosphate dehydrogenase n=1 Tax=Cyanobium sp. PCC 7001 TaxID=180281 RepID=UPI000180553D|nr:NAD(P)H-dependent glycerol-3-phosphate dehydrogenase [Cyanobium sp. PCC 7001]EDY39575.1 NAD(P)H-dependent glycerol-3-phosphate dehydrogenase [Cyanobium sp. PCC 7001]